MKGDKKLISLSEVVGTSPPFPSSMLDSAMRANLCSTLQFVSNIERWEREVGLANASGYQQFDKDCTIEEDSFATLT